MHVDEGCATVTVASSVAVVLLIDVDVMPTVCSAENPGGVKQPVALPFAWTPIAALPGPQLVGVTCRAEAVGAFEKQPVALPFAKIPIAITPAPQLVGVALSALAVADRKSVV